MTNPIILVVDDRPDIRLSARFVLEDNHYEVLEADSPLSAKETLQAVKVDLILLDMNYSLDTTSGDEGLALLKWLSKQDFSIPAVAMTAWSNVELAVRAMQLGAGDFLEKPWKNQRLLQVVSQQLAMSGLKRQNQKLQQRLEVPKQTGYQWQSACMRELMLQIDSVAATDVAILLTGDNGTGKSELASYIHQQSVVAGGPLISVNMGAISESLFESEMFGHKKGAFTDAKENRIGRFELALNGTLFLDEIANIPLSQQAKLLRVLESGEYEVLGSSQTMRTNSRIVSATNGDFTKLIGNEQFREDLYYRLNTIEFRVPSLKERVEDIVPLAQYFVAEFAKKYNRAPATLTECAQQSLIDYHWPGNIREMSHLMERAVLLNQQQTISATNLTLSAKASPDDLPLMTLAAAEHRLIKKAMAKAGSNVQKAADLLGLTKSSMYRRIEKYDDIQK